MAEYLAFAAKFVNHVPQLVQRLIQQLQFYRSSFHVWAGWYAIKKQ